MVDQVPGIISVGPPVWIWWLMCIVALVASFTDVRETRIPNWLTFPLILTGLLQSCVLGGWAGCGDALLGMLVASGLFIWAYLFHGGGAGDAKMMMGVGLWLGFDAAVVVTVAVTAVGFILAMIGVAIRGDIRDIPVVIISGWIKTAQSVRRLISGKLVERTEEEIEAASIKGRRRPKGWIPFAPAILGGIIVGWWYLEAFGPVT